MDKALIKKLSEENARLRSLIEKAFYGEGLEMRQDLKKQLEPIWEQFKKDNNL
jgi:hypothetical protein